MPNIKPLFCDYQLFWHQHRERPPLQTSMQLGPYKYEVMNDDGSIEWRYSDGRAAIMLEALRRGIQAMQDRPVFISLMRS